MRTDMQEVNSEACSQALMSNPIITLCLVPCFSRVLLLLYERKI